MAGHTPPLPFQCAGCLLSLASDGAVVANGAIRVEVGRIDAGKLNGEVPLLPAKAVDLAVVAGEPGVRRIAPIDERGRAVDDDRQLLTPRVTGADLRSLAQMGEAHRGRGGAKPEPPPVEETIDRSDARRASTADRRQIQHLNA